jgi:hypothetical protein
LDYFSTGRHAKSGLPGGEGFSKEELSFSWIEMIERLKARYGQN